MANPQVNLLTGKVNWVDPTLNTDGTAVSQNEITGYQVGLRSTTVAGSAVGTYPIQGPPVASTAVSESLTAIAASIKPDTYAATVRALTATGNSAWAPEFIFDGIFPVPNSPTGVNVS